jgi:hypothetical protein
MLRGIDGDNINGPSLIATPDWLPNRLGKYYLYFAHHRGGYIRLAFADRLEGPWSIYESGTLQLEDATGCFDHVASPDVHVDVERRRIRMYFHGPAVSGSGQRSFVAFSEGGLKFRASNEVLSLFYLRATPWKGQWIGMSKGGRMFLSSDGLGKFERVAEAFGPTDEDANSDGSVRHVALHRIGSRLFVYYSRIGDAPEHILRSTIDLDMVPSEWKAQDEIFVMRPEKPEEGSDLPLRYSKSGPAHGRENALRDPAIFAEGDDLYLLYSLAGESGIGIASLIF